MAGTDRATALSLPFALKSCREKEVPNLQKSRARATLFPVTLGPTQASTAAEAMWREATLCHLFACGLHAKHLFLGISKASYSNT